MSIAKKKKRKKKLFALVVLHSGLGLLLVILLGLVHFSGLNSQVLRLENKVVCQNGSIGLDGFCWQSLPQKKSFQSLHKVCAEDNLQPVSLKQVEKMASSLFLMGVLPNKIPFWTADREPCGKNSSCRVVLKWQQGQLEKKLVRENANHEFSALCAGVAATPKSKRIHVLLPAKSVQN